MRLDAAKRPLVAFAAACAGAIALLGAWGCFDREPPAGWPRSSRPMAVEGTVASACVETKPGDRLILLASGKDRASARIECTLPRGACDRLEPRPGQRLRLEGTLRPPRAPLQPGEYDERAVLASRDVAFVLHARSAAVLERGIPLRWRPKAWAEGFRRSLHRTFRRRLPPDRARLLEGLLFGYKGALDRELQRAVQDAGVMHLLVPSGAKVAWIVGTLLWFFRRRGTDWRIAAGGVGLAGVAFCLIAGAEPPYLRAALGAAVAAGAAARPERDASGVQAIALSALAVLLAWPRALFSAGFQMTYAAALALWVAAPWRLWTRRSRAAATALRVLWATAVVEIALWPMLAGIFGRAALSGSLANVLLVPAAPFAAAAGLLLGLADRWDRLAAWVAPFVSGGLGLFERVCRSFAGLPAAAVDLRPLSRSGIVCWYLGAAGLFVLPRAGLSAAFAALAAGAWTFAKVWTVVRGPRAELCFLSDRTRGALWARGLDGRDWLVDPRLPPARLRAALRALGSAEPARLDAPEELRFGRLRIALKEAPGVALLRRGDGPIEYCILRHSAAVAPRSCAPAVIRSVGREGAVWVITDGQRYQVQSTAAGRPLGRPLL